MKSNEFLTLLRGAAFIFACRFTGAALTFITQVILARWMGVEQMGSYVFAFSVCILLTTMSGLGFPAASVRFIGAALAHRRSDHILGFVRRSLQVSLALSLGVVLIGGLLVLLAEGLVPDDRRFPIYIALLTVPIFALLNSRASVAIALSWFPTAFLPGTVLRPLLFLSLVGAVLYSTGSLSASKAMALQLIAIALVLVLQMVVVGHLLRNTFPENKRSYETRVWVRTAAYLLVISLFTNYFLEINVFISGMLLDNGQLAIFNASFRTAALIMFGLFAVDAITMPKVSKLYAAGDTADLQIIVTQAARLRFFGALVAAIALIIFGKSILALFGEPFIVGYKVLLVLTAVQVINAAFGPVAQVLSVTGNQKLCLRVFTHSLFIMLALHPTPILNFGLVGAAWTVVIVVLIQSTWLHALALRSIGIRTSPFYDSSRWAKKRRARRALCERIA